MIDPEFASAAEWAQLYRTKAIQVVPACSHVEVKPGTAWKRPLFSSWTEFQEALVPDDKFNEWYGPHGRYVARLQMGTICGRASGGMFVIDLDTYKNPAAAAWWQGLLALHNNNMPLETPEQRTGGGGLQKLFRAPAGWTPPTCKTSVGVDIRGQGGFAMLAPSMHESGRAYEWLDGLSPDEVEIAVAPDWLVAAIDALVVQHGGTTQGRQNPSNGTEKINMPPPAGSFDGFGHQVDGREEYMRDMVWRCVVKWHRACPIRPSEAESQAKAAEEYEIYARRVGPQQPPPPGVTRDQQMEREGRGPTEWWSKWKRAIKQWDGRVRDDAAKPDPHPDNDAGQRGPDYTDEFKAEPKVDPATGQPLPLILTAKEFLAHFIPPDYLVDGMLRKSYLISLTARTGHGKTAVAMALGACVARGTAFHGKQVAQGGVLFFAGENPDDIRARYLAMAQHEGFDPEGIPFHFVDGVININTSLAQIRLEAAKVPALSLIIVDTQAAYFPGDEGNSNEQQGWFARLLRELISLPGKPTVLVNCHPVKNAAQDNLIPMGGSAFLNEVDANLTLWAEDKTCELGPHPDKWRGVTFESMSFELRVVTSDRLKDTKGRHIPSVIAVPITEAGAERRAAVGDEDEKTVLRYMHANKNASFTVIARAVGFVLPDGEPAKAKVQRIIKRLSDSKFVYKYHKSKYRLTKKGCKLIGVKWKDADEDEE
jgi:hypothetical protein